MEDFKKMFLATTIYYNDNCSDCTLNKLFKTYILRIEYLTI